MRLGWSWTGRGGDIHYWVTITVHSTLSILDDPSPRRDWTVTFLVPTDWYETSKLAAPPVPGCPAGANHSYAPLPPRPTRCASAPTLTDCESGVQETTILAGSCVVVGWGVATTSIGAGSAAKKLMKSRENPRYHHTARPVMSTIASTTKIVWRVFISIKSYLSIYRVRFHAPRLSTLG